MCHFNVKEITCPAEFGMINLNIPKHYEIMHGLPRNNYTNVFPSNVPFTFIFEPIPCIPMSCQPFMTWIFFPSIFKI